MIIEDSQAIKQNTYLLRPRKQKWAALEQNISGESQPISKIFELFRIVFPFCAILDFAQLPSIAANLATW